MEEEGTGRKKERIEGRKGRGEKERRNDGRKEGNTKKISRKVLISFL